MAKIIKTEDMNDRQKKMRTIVDQIIDQGFPQIWNIYCQGMNIFNPITGDELIGFGSTLAALFLCRFVIELKKVTDDDDTIYTVEEIINNIIETAAAMLNGKTIDRSITQAKPSEIKKVKPI